MNPRNPRRKIYDRSQLNKQAQKNRQITGPIRKKKINLAQDIVKEIEKEDNDIVMADIEDKEKAGDEQEKSIKSENEPEEKEPKKKIERLKLDAKTLLYNRDSGLRKYYEVITNTEFKSKDVKKNLDKLINITRNWHFMLFPKYDFDYFTNKLISLGKQAPTKSYMSRVRRIYKGEQKWDIIYDEQEQILGKASIMNNEKKEFENPNPEIDNEINKEINSEKNNNEIKDNNNNNLNKKDELDYDDEEQGIIRDLFLKDEILEEIDNKKEGGDDNKNNVNEKKEEEFEVKDSDFDNFPEDFNHDEEIIEKEKDKNNKNKIEFNGVQIDGNEKPEKSEINTFNEKRTSMQVDENINNTEINKEMKPDSMNNKIILDK